MRKSIVTRDFAMSYPDLMQLGDKAVALITRDAAELALYGIDNAVKTLIAAKTQELKDFATDEELEGAVSDATEAKNLTADRLKVAIRSIMTRVRNRFGEKSGKYRKFGSKGMDTMNDRELVQLGKRVVRMATLYRPELASKGLTTPMITDLNTIVTQFDTEIDTLDDAIRSRDIATEDRLELGNLLYSKITEVFDYGKDHWITRDEAKYNDYVLYENAGGTPPAPSSISFIIALTDADRTISFDYVGNTFATGDMLTQTWETGIFNTVVLSNGIHGVLQWTYSTSGEKNPILTGGIDTIGEMNIANNRILRFIPAGSNKIRNLNAWNNQMDAPSVNSVLIWLDANGESGGTATLSGGTNAPPTGAGITAKNSLIAKGWTVETN